MTLDYRVTGEGHPLLIMYGAGEDADLLQPQAEALAARGYRVVTYNRRGTGPSPRGGWPTGGVPAHVADAARLITEAAGEPATVLGLSSGGILALALAEAHPELVREVIAWEVPALAILPDGLALHAQMLQPIEDYLRAHPQDWSGAYDVLLGVLSGGAADLNAPAVQRMRCNAEAALRDDGPVITAYRISPRIGSSRVVIATGGDPDPLLDQIASALAEGFGTTVLVVPEADDHEIYLSRPEVLAAAFARSADRSLA